MYAHSDYPTYSLPWAKNKENLAETEQLDW